MTRVMALLWEPTFFSAVTSYHPWLCLLSQRKMRNIKYLIFSSLSLCSQLGKIAVIGGCREYTGAPYFAAISALKIVSLHNLFLYSLFPLILHSQPGLVKLYNWNWFPSASSDIVLVNFFFFFLVIHIIQLFSLPAGCRSVPCILYKRCRSCHKKL